MGDVHTDAVRRDLAARVGGDVAVWLIDLCVNNHDDFRQLRELAGLVSRDLVRLNSSSRLNETD